MKRDMKVTWRSINRAGLPTDYKEAIKQYIWNAIEADATKVDIGFGPVDDELTAINKLYIEDNGSGIRYEDLDSTFGSFLDSTKQSRFTKGGKGKGRLSFQCFASRATWYTTYTAEDNKNYFHTITILEAEHEKFDDSTPKEVKDPTGTKVDFGLLKGVVTSPKLQSEEFEQFIALEFGWYLKTRMATPLEICLNGKPFDYRKYIREEDTHRISVASKREADEIIDFDISYILWSEKIGTESNAYFINDRQQLIEKKPTGFNTVAGRAYGFVHSVYVTSPFFSNFAFSNKPPANNATLELEEIAANQTDPVFKEFFKQLQAYLETKRDEYLKKDSDTAIERFKKNNTLPTFGSDIISATREADYIEVLKGVYKTAPTLFLNLQKPQEKSILGFLELALRSDEREHVIDLVGQIVELRPEERKELAELLHNAKLSGVIKLLKILEARYAVAELLKELVFKHTKTATERGQLQNAIENNCWLFGEEYNLIGADDSFSKLEALYLKHIDEVASDEADNNARRPDIFIARNKKIASGLAGTGLKIQNLILELKRPSVNVGVEQYRQLEDYRNIIRSNPTFKSGLREWHFYIIGVEIEPEIVDKREAHKSLNRQFLVDNEGDYYIYAISWQELFDAFEIRHDYLLDELKIDKAKVLEKIKSEIDLDDPQVVADTIVAQGESLKQFELDEAVEHVAESIPIR